MSIEAQLKRAKMSGKESEQSSLYDAPSFELDATTITALLGAAIAFQFFVLGNL